MQFYDTDVNKEYAIRGNSAVLKCVVPSFVADFVTVLSWHTDQGEEFVRQDEEMGTILINVPYFGECTKIANLEILKALFWKSQCVNNN